MDFGVNYLAVVVAAAAAFLLGWAWHSVLFGKQWLKLMGYNSMQDAMGGAVSPTQAMVLNGIAMLVMAFVLAHLSFVWHVSDWTQALKLGGWTWLGFMAPVAINQVLWGKKSWGLYAFTVIYLLVTVEVMALIVGLWR